METIKVYRFEIEKDGSWKGPFSAGHGHRTCPNGIMKEPEEEGLKFTWGMLSAVERPCQMMNWVSPIQYKEMYEMGYRLAIYEVKEAQHGETQSVFHKSDIVNIERIENWYEAKEFVLADEWRKFGGDEEYVQRKLSRLRKAREKRQTTGRVEIV